MTDSPLLPIPPAGNSCSTAKLYVWWNCWIRILLPKVSHNISNSQFRLLAFMATFFLTISVVFTLLCKTLFKGDLWPMSEIYPVMWISNYIYFIWLAMGTVPLYWNMLPRVNARNPGKNRQSKSYTGNSKFYSCWLAKYLSLCSNDSQGFFAKDLHSWVMQLELMPSCWRVMGF